MACVTTHGCYLVFSFITTSCKVRGPFLTLRGEPEGCGLPTGRATDDNQAPCLEGLETMTAVALVPRPGTSQVLRTTPSHAAGALVVHRSPVEELFVPS